MLATSVGALIVNLATGIVTARLLGPTGRGEQAAILVWVQIAGGLTSLGIPSALTYYLRIRQRDAQALLSASLILAGIQGSLGGLIGALLVIPHALGNYSPVIVTAAQVAMVATPFVTVGYAVLGALYGRLEVGRVNVFTILQPVTTLLTLLVLALVGSLTPVSSAIAYLGPSGLATILLLHHTLRTIGVTRHALRPAGRRLLSYAVRSYGLELFATISQNMDQAVLAVRVGPTSLGIYVVASRMAAVVSVVQKALRPVLLSRGAGRSAQEQAAMSGRAARVALVVTLIGGTPLFVLAPQLLSGIFGGRFAAGSTVMRILLVEETLGMAAVILGSSYFNVGRPGVVSVLELVTTVVGFTLIMLLTPTYGIEGAATAILISTSVYLALVLGCFRPVLGVRPPTLLPRRRDFDWLLDVLRHRDEQGDVSD